MITILHNPAGTKRLGDLLIDNLNNQTWSSFRAAIAFAKRSGVKHVAFHLTEFAKRAHVKISLGLDQCGTSYEAVEDLLKTLGSIGELWLFHNEAPGNPTFHPKLYLFSNAQAAECFVGSGNLTEGGLFTNYEVFVRLQLDRTNHADELFLQEAEHVLDLWSEADAGTARRADAALIADLKAKGYLPSEAEIQRVRSLTSEVTAEKTTRGDEKIFASVPVTPAPRVPKMDLFSYLNPTLNSAPGSQSSGFVITLQNTDVGVGQTTRGTSRRSPELFIPKACVVTKPEFWGWPILFKPDPAWTGKIDRDGFGKMDRQGVRMRLGTSILVTNWWYNPNKIDFRIRNESLRSAGNVGDILKIEQAGQSDGYDYYVEIIQKGTSEFAKFDALCTERVRNSPKRFGYY